MVLWFFTERNGEGWAGYGKLVLTKGAWNESQREETVERIS